MKSRALEIMMWSLAISISVAVLLAARIAYLLNAWLQVDPVPVSAEASEEERLDAVDRWLEGLLSEHKFNGGVLVARDGQVLLLETYGFCDHTATRRLDAHTAFRLASVSKQFTAAGILRLAETGALELDDPVAKHLSSFVSDQVTIRHLLNQTSGIPDVYMDLAEKHRKEIGETLTISDVVSLVNKHGGVKHPPGERMEYSNTNYVLLAGIVESASGICFEEFMREELFKPLGMNDTRVWNLLSLDRSPNQADDFDQIDEERTPVETTWIDGVAGDGAVFCSLHDMVIWDQFWTGNSLVRDELLSQALKAPALNDGTASDYGFGWVINRKGHWHNGAWLGANTFIARYPGSKCCLVVLDNSSNIRLDSIADHLVTALKPILAEEQ